MAGTAPDGWKIAVDALARRELSLEEVRRRLARRKVSSEQAALVLRRLVERGYVDDRRVAYNHALFRAQQGRRGPLRVRAELIARGLGADLVEEAVAAAFTEHPSRESVGRVAARLCGRQGVPCDRRGRERLARRLSRAGFPAAEVMEWLQSLPQAEESEDDLS
jgi:regulatory protein